jgi:hypothetical protein
MKPIITLLGYKNQSHTNYWPWLRFKDVFDHHGYDCEWIEAKSVKRGGRPRIFICWNSPACDKLVTQGIYDHSRGDTIVQKLTSLGAGDEHVNWGTDALSFFKTWKWNTYRRVERFFDVGINIHTFGCKTNTDLFPEKHRIVTKLGERAHWFNWGPCLYSWDEIQTAIPITDGFKHDLGYVGMKWGGVGRGNVDTFEAFMDPLIKKFPNNAIAGAGNSLGTVSNGRHKEILRQSRLCPVIHCASWIAEKGIQDRFWTVFSTGRFGIVDNPGIYEFFNEDEVVCETDADEYVEKSVYYAKNVDKQVPFIEKAQARIKTEYNFYVQWRCIMDKIWKQMGYDW